MMEAQWEHPANIDWQRGKWADAEGKYSREHTCRRQVQGLGCVFSSAGGISRRREGRPGEDVRGGDRERAHSVVVALGAWFGIGGPDLQRKRSVCGVID
jgi:hypothetical protein